MKAIFLVGGPGSGKHIIMKEIFKGRSFKEYDSNQIRQAKQLTDNLIVIMGNAYDIESIGFDKVVVESRGYETFMVYVDVSRNVCDNRASFLSEDVREGRYYESKNNITQLKSMFEGFSVVCNNDIDNGHNGYISRQIRLEQLNKVESKLGSFLFEEPVYEPKQQNTQLFDEILESSSSRIRKRLTELCPSCILSRPQNPEKNNILYNEEEKYYGSPVTKIEPKKQKKSKFEQDNNTEKDKKSNITGDKRTTTDGTGVGDQTALRYGGDSGSNFNMSGLGSVTYRESVMSFFEFRKHIEEAIDSPSFDGDMSCIGGYGSSNKEPIVSQLDTINSQSPPPKGKKRRNK